MGQYCRVITFCLSCIIVFTGQIYINNQSFCICADLFQVSQDHKHQLGKPLLCWVGSTCPRLQSCSERKLHVQGKWLKSLISFSALMAPRWVGYTSWCLITILQWIMFVRTLSSSVMWWLLWDIYSAIVWLCCLVSKVKKQYALSLKEQVDLHLKCAAVLCALSAYLPKDDSKFLKLWDVSQCIKYSEFLRNKNQLTKVWTLLLQPVVVCVSKK